MLVSCLLASVSSELFSLLVFFLLRLYFQCCLWRLWATMKQFPHPSTIGAADTYIHMCQQANRLRLWACRGIRALRETSSHNLPHNDCPILSPMVSNMLFFPSVNTFFNCPFAFRTRNIQRKLQRKGCCILWHSLLPHHLRLIIFCTNKNEEEKRKIHSRTSVILSIYYHVGLRRVQKYRKTHQKQHC